MMLRKRQPLPTTFSPREFLGSLKWLDRTPLVVEPYRLDLFNRFFTERDEQGRLRYNLGLFGRAKKNWKSADAMLAAFFALLVDSPGGNQIYVIANDAGQGGDDMEIAKGIRKVNPLLADATTVRKNLIERKDHRGFIEVLAAGDATGAHGKTYRLLVVDEVHGYKDWNLLEALALDPTRADAQQWVTSYSSMLHRKGVPLYDMLQIGKAGTDPGMLLSWYGGDWTTDLAFADATPECRANPSMGSWNNPDYLDQQRRRLPHHQYQRLHLNIGGGPVGAAFSAEIVDAAIPRGVAMRKPERSTEYVGFCDMSGGSNDDATLAIAHLDPDGRAVLDVVLNQGGAPPFDPRRAVTRFVAVLKDYRISNVVGDSYAGLTFAYDFQNAGIGYTASERTRSELYEAMEPKLNGAQLVLLDVPTLEQQLLGLVWRGGKIDHPAGEHDDWANAAAGALVVAAGDAAMAALDPALMAMNASAPSALAGVSATFYGSTSTSTSGAADLERVAFGGFIGGGAFDLGRRAFGGD